METIPCLVFRQQDFRCGYDDDGAAIGPPDIRAWKNHHTKAHVILLYSLDQCHLYPIPFSSSPFSILWVTLLYSTVETLFNPICLQQLADHRTIVRPLSSYRVYSEKKTCSWVIYPDVSTCDWPVFQKSGYWFWKCGLELFNTRCGCNFFFCPDFDSLATCVSFMLFLQIEISIFCVNFLWNKQPPVCSMAIYSPQKLGKNCNYKKLDNLFQSDKWYVFRNLATIFG